MLNHSKNNRSTQRCKDQRIKKLWVAHDSMGANSSRRGQMIGCKDYQEICLVKRENKENNGETLGTLLCLKTA